MVVLGECGRCVDQTLLVATLDERHRLRELIQGLPEDGDVAVTKDAESRRDQPAAYTGGDGVVAIEVGDDRLRDGQADGGTSSHCRISFQIDTEQIWKAE